MALFILIRKQSAQVWYTDFAIGLFIFVALMFFYVDYSPNLATKENIQRSKLMSEGMKISGTLLTSGIPESWNETNVTVVGLTQNNYRLNETKFLQAGNLSVELLKQSLGIDDEFYVELQNSSKDTINISSKCGFGAVLIQYNETTQSCPKFNLVNVTPEHLIKTWRLIIRDNRMLKLVVYTWA